MSRSEKETGCLMKGKEELYWDGGPDMYEYYLRIRNGENPDPKDYGIDFTEPVKPDKYTVIYDKINSGQITLKEAIKLFEEIDKEE